MKKIECYQPRGIVKMLIYLFLIIIHSSVAVILYTNIPNIVRKIVISKKIEQTIPSMKKSLLDITLTQQITVQKRKRRCYL